MRAKAAELEIPRRDLRHLAELPGGFEGEREWLSVRVQAEEWAGRWGPSQAGFRWPVGSTA
jgi:hypothetical protein